MAFFNGCGKLLILWIDMNLFNSACSFNIYLFVLHISLVYISRFSMLLTFATFLIFCYSHSDLKDLKELLLLASLTVKIEFQHYMCIFVFG